MRLTGVLTRLVALAFVAGAWVLPVAAQIPGGGVGQSGSVTANDCAAWVGNGLIKDSGGACGGGGGLTVGTTTITSGTNPYILYDNNGVLGNLQTIPVANGGTNCTSASITCFNNITGFTAAGTTGTTSTNLVFSTSPTLVTPVLGAATGTSLALGGCTIGSQAFCETGAASLNGVETILSGGNIGFGTETNPQGPFVFSKNVATGLPATSPVDIIGADGSGAGFGTYSYANNNAIGMLRAEGTGASPTSLGAGVTIGSIAWGGYVTGTGFVTGKGRIFGFSLESGTWSSTNQGTGFEFDTTPAGSTTRAQAGRFMSGFIVGTSTTDPGPGNESLAKNASCVTAPGASALSICATPGTSGGTCKLVALAGTSTTPVTIIDNVGSGC